jgi:hypothetical protein
VLGVDARPGVVGEGPSAEPADFEVDEDIILGISLRTGSAAAAFACTSAFSSAAFAATASLAAVSAAFTASDGRAALAAPAVAVALAVERAVRPPEDTVVGGSSGKEPTGIAAPARLGTLLWAKLLCF